jgi:hypothetical protein
MGYKCLWIIPMVQKFFVREGNSWENGNNIIWFLTQSSYFNLIYLFMNKIITYSKPFCV